LGRDVLGASASSDPNRSERLERLTAVLEGLPHDRAELLAAVALLLGRVAYADNDVSAAERERIGEILVEDLGISAAQATSLAELTLERELCVGSDHHIVLRRIRELARPEEIPAFIRILFRLASADDISSSESDEISQVARGLGLSHDDFIAIRSEFREYLAVLKGLSVSEEKS
jgi:uncharacterized tellurite resistance protein B-like protein